MVKELEPAGKVTHIYVGDSDDEAGSMKSWCQTSNINWLMSDDDDEAKSIMTSLSMLEEVY